MKVKIGDYCFKLHVLINIGKMYLFVYLFTILYVFIIQVNTVTAYPFLQFNSFNFSKNVNWQPDHCDTGVHGVTNA